MKIKGNMEIEFPDVESAKSAYTALSTETGFSRAKVKTTSEKKTVSICIEAKDVVAFRAAANGVLRNLQVFESIEEKE